MLPATANYNPYNQNGFAGDLTAAQDAMKQSVYDTNQDGMCDAPECKFLLLANNTSPWTNMNPILVQDLAKIGLTAQLSEVKPDVVNSQTVTVDKLIPMSFGQGWAKDFGSPYGFDFFVVQRHDDQLHRLLRPGSARHDRGPGQGVRGHGRVQQGDHVLPGPQAAIDR